ncbi:DUF2946 family protein [Bradyrhizobium sp. HKCCYLRH2060]|uniref:DUF2946 family protein n=1 Tax=Bradyrhizobium TaxID=374 RepID=UPI0028E3BF2F|nr:MULTISPECIES: DUF2946 family protein [unclassified Bradyrhizobium]
MRQRLQAFLPIMLIALMVQILAPIGVAWAAASAAADPLYGLEICHGQLGSQPIDDGSPASPALHGCSLCCLAQPVTLDGPELSTIAVPQRDSGEVVWRAGDRADGITKAFSNAQARAPPAA